MQVEIRKIDILRALNAGESGKGLVYFLVNKLGYERFVDEFGAKIELVPATADEFELHHVTGHIKITEDAQ